MKNKREIHKRKHIYARSSKRFKRIQSGKDYENFKEKKREKRAEKCKNLEVKEPHTIESKRKKDPFAFPEKNQNIYEEINKTVFDSIKNPSYIPKILITTSKRPSKNTYSFAKELIQLFPYSTFVKRGVQFEIDKISEYCIKRNYTTLIVINENRKVPGILYLSISLYIKNQIDHLIIIHLPIGPSFYFTLSSIKPISCIYQHGHATSHIPELIINNFITPLGSTVEYMFRSLFPTQPEIEGRQVVTIHNQRDFIFVRKHRYIFKNDVKVSLQELGPQFTLKLRRIERGIHDKEKKDVLFEYNPNEESNRRRFWLS